MFPFIREYQVSDGDHQGTLWQGLCGLRPAVLKVGHVPHDGCPLRCKLVVQASLGFSKQRVHQTSAGSKAQPLIVQEAFQQFGWIFLQSFEVLCFTLKPLGSTWVELNLQRANITLPKLQKQLCMSCLALPDWHLSGLVLQHFALRSFQLQFNLPNFLTSDRTFYGLVHSFVHFSKTYDRGSTASWNQTTSERLQEKKWQELQDLQ